MERGWEKKIMNISKYVMFWIISNIGDKLNVTIFGAPCVNWFWILFSVALVLDIISVMINKGK